MTHTLGPWAVTYEECGGYDCMSSAYWVCKGGQTVATLDVHDYDSSSWEAQNSPHPVAQANARLIAAAPDLLVACKAMLAADLQSLKQWSDARGAARGAIHKARGGD